MRRFDYVTFDCYGTLIDWEEGIGDAFVRAAAEDGVSLDRAEFLRAYAATEPRVEHDAYRSYRDVLAETATDVAHMLGWRLEPHRAIFLAESLPRWKPFADTNPALERLRRTGHRLGILSNVDNDLLAVTQGHFTVDFDLVITAEQVRSYKPGHAHFLAARERISDSAWLHAAQSNFHDIVPTNALEIANAWINRHHEQPLPGGIPRHEFANLEELAKWLV